VFIEKIPRLQRSRVESANAWFDRHKRLEQRLLVRGVETKRVKIAIIDTGAVFTKSAAHINYDDRIIGFWPANDVSRTEGKVGLDYDGHGTHMASALLRVDPFCHLYVARAFGKRDEQQSREMAEEVQHKVVSVRQVLGPLRNVSLILFLGNPTCNTRLES
jgi:hypothetical protein